MTAAPTSGGIDTADPDEAGVGLSVARDDAVGVGLPTPAGAVCFCFTNAGVPVDSGFLISANAVA